MLVLRRLSILCVFVALGACASPAQKVPDPVQPKLESVRITGGRICGASSAAAAARTTTFACTELPTREPTGWRLTPLYAPSLADPKRFNPNRVVVLNVSGPGKTELDVELVRSEGQLNLPITLVTPDLAAGVPGEVAITRQAGVTVIDDGSRKMWLMEVVVSTCADARHLRIFNRAAKDAERSAPLDITLIRDPAEQACVDQPGQGVAVRPGVGEPVNPRVTGSCAGSGGTGKLFQICESCPTLHPDGLGVFSTGRYCTWDEVLAAYGYVGEGVVKPRICKLSQVGSREACEGK